MAYLIFYVYSILCVKIIDGAGFLPLERTT